MRETEKSYTRFKPIKARRENIKKERRQGKKERSYIEFFFMSERLDSRFVGPAPLNTTPMLLLLVSALAFMPELELRLVGFTPRGAFISDTDAITVTFNRAVIPLGGDIGAPLPEDKVPFDITMRQSAGAAALPPMCGTFRWVTTLVARFDPCESWPTDAAVPDGRKLQPSARDKSPPASLRPQVRWRRAVRGAACWPNPLARRSS